MLPGRARQSDRPGKPYGEGRAPGPRGAALLLKLLNFSCSQYLFPSDHSDHFLVNINIANLPRGQARAGRRQVGGGVHALAAPGLRRRHEPVRRHLGAHRRGRPAQLPRNLPARRPALQHPLDRVPLVPREPSVGPRDCLLGATLPLSGHAVLRSHGAGMSGPQGIGFPYSSAHVRMNMGGVRMKLPIKEPLLMGNAVV